MICKINFRAPLSLPPDSLHCSPPTQVSILFADIVGFTDMSKTQPPDAVMELLNNLFTRWDAPCVGVEVYRRCIRYLCVRVCVRV